MAYQRGMYESMWSPMNFAPPPPFDPRFSTSALATTNMRHLNTHTLDTQAPQPKGTEAMLDRIVDIKVQREVQREVQPLARQQEQLLAIWKNDARTLESRICELEASMSTALRLDYAPTRKMLEDNTSEELIRAYQETAQAREEVALRVQEEAKRLRKEAEALTGEHTLQLKGTDTSETTLQDSGYACCQTSYDDVASLLEHVQKIHGTTHAQTISPAGAGWVPMIVRQMPPVAFEVPEHRETFSFDFLTRNLGGDLWSPGFFFESGQSILPSKSYWLLNADYEPFLPRGPGLHGAKLTAFFNETAENAPEPENYMDAPVFVIEKGAKEYRYYGNYSQSRCPDTVGYDTLHEHVPEETLRRCAEQLSDKDRPEWVTRALMNHFWTKPTYTGPMPHDSALNTPEGTGTSEESEQSVGWALDQYAERLKAWEKKARLHVNLLTTDNLFESFKKPDQDIEPGLRLWWEYLECVKYDSRFYEMLVKFKHQPKLQRKKKRVVVQSPPMTTAPDVGGNTVTGGEIETVPAGHSEEIKVPTKEEDESSHPARQDPKRVQIEQWKAFDMKAAEEQAQKSTTFVKPDFSDKPKPQTKGLSQTAAKKHEDPVQSTNSWQTSNGDQTKSKDDSWGNSWGDSSNSWSGAGDLEGVKKFRNELAASGQWKHDKFEAHKGKGKQGTANGKAKSNETSKSANGGRGGIRPPHARGK